MPERPVPDPNARLRTLLDADPPASVLSLPTEARAALADLLEDSRRRQDASLEQAFEATLKHVPFPVRAIVKKVLTG